MLSAEIFTQHVNIKSWSDSTNGLADLRMQKSPGGQVVRASNFGSGGPRFESVGSRIHLMIVRRFIAELFIIILPSSLYDLKNVERDVNHQITIIIMIWVYSETCVRKPPLRSTLVADVEMWLSYKGTCHVILKLHDMYLYKTNNFFHINHYLKSVSKVALLHRFHYIYFLKSL